MALPSGYSFTSRLGFHQLAARLAELDHGTWEERDNDVYGTYITGYLWGVRMRIWDGQGSVSELGTYDPGGFMLLDYARGQLDKISADQHRRIRDELLPALEVTQWKPDERND